MIEPGLLNPRTTVYYRQVPDGFHVLWSDSETVVVDFDVSVFKIRQKWITRKQDFGIDLSEAYAYVTRTNGDPNDETVLTPSDSAEMPVMAYTDWLALLRKLRERYPDEDGN